MKAKDIVAEKRASARKDAEKRRKELRAVEAVAAAWPEGVGVDRIFPISLYGAVAEVAIGSDFQRYGEPETRKTLEDVAVILDAVPPVPVYKIRDGCCAFRPDWDVSDDEAMAENSELIWGVLLDANHGVNAGYGTQRVRWFSQVGQTRVEVVVVLAPASCPVRVSIRTRSDRRTGKVLEVLETSLEVARKGFWLDQRVKWAAGSHEYASNFTLYWLGIDDSQGPGKAWLEQVCGIV